MNKSYNAIIPITYLQLKYHSTYSIIEENDISHHRGIG